MILLTVLPTVCILCAAISDWRKRIIPDWTWIAVLLIGAVCMAAGECIGGNLPEVFYIPIAERVAGLVCPATVLIIAALTRGGVGGGDIKLTAALGFTYGLFGLLFILCFSVVPACLYSFATKQKSIPLAVFLAIGFLVYTCIPFG